VTAAEKRALAERRAREGFLVEADRLRAEADRMDRAKARRARGAS